MMRNARCVRLWALLVIGAIEICLTGACTSRGLYEARQQDAHTACLSKISGIERDKCLERTSQSYDDYTREREKVQQEQP
jgi:hypothetical protein